MKVEEPKFSNIWSVEQQGFVSHLLQKNSNIVSIVYQTSRSASKPTKHDNYVTIYGSNQITETTPNGINFLISADAFTEVNHDVENYAFQLMLEWFSRLPNNKKSWDVRNLVVMGRDINTNVLGTHHFGWFQNIYAFSHCPRAIQDCRFNVQKMGLENVCIFQCEKSKIGRVLFNELNSPFDLHMFISASRNGLSKETIELIKSKPNVTQIIYNSCNQQTLIRDMQFFLAGADGGFYVRDFRSLNCLSGTEYKFSMTLLERRPPTVILTIGTNKQSHI